MPRTRAFDLGEVTARAMNAFWRCGYEATSIEDLVAATGLSRSSIYQAFGSKRGLFDAALNRYLDGIESKLEPLQSSGGGLDGIIQFFESWEPIAAAGAGSSMGCLVVNSVAELANTQPWMRDYGDAYQTRLRQAFIRALAVAADRREIRPESIERRAQLLTLVTLGLFVAARGQAPEVVALRASDAVAEISSWRSSA